MKRLDRIALGRALFLAREALRLTTREIAARTGVSAATVSRAERAHPDIYQSAESVLLLCDHFDVDPFAFLVTVGGGEFSSGDVFHEKTPMKQAGRGA
ncbi:MULTISPECIES: helix-turn-helix transcriptional regulator [Alphaproteobacteria]|uniref:helix-turn-helix domain-containing protein n=1 Tax=Alphaproteobacteria TaxID=28211 RepID=UPI003266E4D2